MSKGKSAEFSSKKNYFRDNNNYDNAYHVQPTKFTKAFFSDTNVDTVMDALKKNVYLYSEAKFGIPLVMKKIERKELLSVMKTIMNYYRRHIPESESLKKNLLFINKELIDHLTPRLTGNCIAYMRFLKDLKDPYRLIPNPIQTKFKQSELSLDKYYNQCGN